MLTYRQQVADALEAVLSPLTPTAPRSAEILTLLEEPPQSEMGDIAFPCFRLAKELRKAPPQISALLKEAIEKEHPSLAKSFSEVKSLGPYLNFFLNPKEVIQRQFESTLKAFEAGTPFGLSTYGKNQQIVLEYSSPNIGKPMHIGHLRVTIVGAALNRIYRHAGFNVVSINHIGDWGSQFGKLAVAFKKWGSEKALREDPFKHLSEIYVRFHKETESDPSLEALGAEAFKKLENGDPEVKAVWKTITELSLKEYERIYEKIDARFDQILGESFYEDKMPDAISLLKKKGLLKESQGAQIVDLEPYGMIPMIMLKSDGSTIYATRDLAAALYRAKTWPFQKMIYVVGAQQELHFRQLFKVLELLGFEWAKDCIHVKTGWYQFKGVSLSTRKGQTLLLEEVFDKAKEKALEVIEEKNPNLPNKKETALKVSMGATVFADLFTDPVKDVNFDFDRVLDFNGETGPYVQYTYARASSILRKVKEAHPDLTPKVDASLLDSPECLALAKRLLKFEMTLIHTISENRPSVLAHYLIDLASEFNRFYLSHRILGSEEEPIDETLKRARLAVVMSTRKVLSECMRLLGIPAPEQM